MAGARKPQYKSRLHIGNRVIVEGAGLGTIHAVKFTEANVFYDVSFGGNVIKDIPSLSVQSAKEAE